MSLVIKAVETRKELREFVEFPLKLYKDCPYYVPSLFGDEMVALDPSRNPMGRYSDSRLFVAMRDGELVGRVAAIVNHIANRDWEHQEVRFGWMDFVDDREVSSALLGAVVAFGKEKGMDRLTGPLGFTDFDNEGCVVEGFDDISSFSLKYNYSYYARHFEAFGLQKANDWLEFRIFIPDQVSEKVTRAAALVAERYNLHMRRLTRREALKKGYGRKVFELINKTYCKLFDFTVFPADVIDYYVNNYLGMLDFRYVPMVEDAEGRLVGFAITMPSLAHAVRKCGGKLFPLGWWHLLRSMYLRHEEAIELLLIAIDPEYQNRGVNAMLFNELIPNLIKGGFRYGESNAEMESNLSVQNMWNDYRREFKRRRRVYSKDI